MTRAERELTRLLGEVRRCRVCRDAPRGRRLPHEPRPVLRPSATARLCICSQAPGVRVHASGIPFSDASGDRLRGWLGVTREEFYDTTRIAIVPIGLCFPGHAADGGDLPPRPECAPLWQERIFATMPRLELILLVGGYAQRWHLRQARTTTSETVGRWRELLGEARIPRRVVLPHPSWRNNRWLADNSWFTRDMLPDLRREVRRLL
jgi:uracil-DNA glycosylase